MIRRAHKFTRKASKYKSIKGFSSHPHCATKKGCRRNAQVNIARTSEMMWGSPMSKLLGVVSSATEAKRQTRKKTTSNFLATRSTNNTPRSRSSLSQLFQCCSQISQIPQRHQPQTRRPKCCSETMIQAKKGKSNTETNNSRQIVNENKHPPGGMLPKRIIQWGLTT